MRDSSARPLQVDVAARETRERLERLALCGGNDAEVAQAARELVQLCAEHPEYRLCVMAPDLLAPKVEKAKQIPAQWASRCTGCDGRVIPGAMVWWVPGTKGVRCLQCGANT